MYNLYTTQEKVAKEIRTTRVEYVISGYLSKVMSKTLTNILKGGFDKNNWT